MIRRRSEYLCGRCRDPREVVPGLGREGGGDVELRESESVSRAWRQSAAAGKAVAARLGPGQAQEPDALEPASCQVEVCSITLTTPLIASTMMETDTRPPALMKRRKCADPPTGMSNVLQLQKKT